MNIHIQVFIWAYVFYSLGCIYLRMKLMSHMVTPNLLVEIMEILTETGFHSSNRAT